MLEACFDARPRRRDHPAAGPPPRGRRGDPLQRHRGAARGGRRGPRHRARGWARSCRRPIRAAADLARICARSIRTAWRRSPAGARRSSPSSAAPRSSGSPVRRSPWPRTSSRAARAAPTRTPRRSCTASPRLGTTWPARLAGPRRRASCACRSAPAPARCSSSTPGPGRSRRRDYRRLRPAALAPPCFAGRRRPRRAADPLRRGHRRAAHRPWASRAPTSSASTSGCRCRMPPAGSAPDRALQGNLDPALLFAPLPVRPRAGRARPRGGRRPPRAHLQPRPRRAPRHRPGRADPGGGVGARTAAMICSGGRGRADRCPRGRAARGKVEA